MFGRKKAFLSACVLVLALAAGTPVLAQNATGRIIGTVFDPQGAVIPGAKVTVINATTGVANPAVTNREGYFEVLALPIGVYKVTVEQKGFSTAESQEKKLSINESLRFDITLTVSGGQQVVQVEAQVSGVETVNPTVGESVTERQVSDLPLNGRNVLRLALLQPGVTEANSDAGGGGFSISGGRTDAVTYILDGGLNNNLMRNSVVFNPNPDAIAEFRILTSNYTAEYGRNGGGIISVVTKSGGNQLHGSAFDFIRNDAFNANSFFNNSTNLPRNILKRNQFGATLGGPIMIPHLVHGKDRFFFFVSYQGQRQTAAVSNTQIPTFTPAQLQGDFSQAFNGGPDPSVVAFLHANPFFQANPALAANGIIDPTKINPIALNIIKLGLIPTSPTGLFSSSAASKANNNELTVKTDYSLSDRDKLTVTFGGNHSNLLNPYGDGVATVPGFDDTTRNNISFFSAGYTRTVSPSILNEFRFTAQRQLLNQEQPVQNLPGPQQLGFLINPDANVGPPVIVFNSGLSLGFSENGPTQFADTTFAYSDNLTWIKGRHTWKFGAAYTAFEDNLRFGFESSGQFFFANNSVNSTGNSFADFLLGNPTNFSQGPAAPNNVRTKAVSFFGQDEWHVRNDLFLTLGLRYEYSTPKLDTRGRTDNILTGVQSTVFPGAPTGLVFPGDPGAPKGLYQPDKNNFAPRIGFAWSPIKKTSIRGGFGVFFDVINGADNIDQNGAQPFASFSNVNMPALPASITSGIPYFRDPYGSVGLTNPFPTPPASSLTDWGAVGFLPFGATSDDPNIRTPYIYQYNLSVQREIANNLVAQIGYVGSDSKKLQTSKLVNAMVLGTTTRRLNADQSSASIQAFCSSFAAANGFANAASACPFAGGLPVYSNGGSANYNSLQASLTKRVSSGFFGNTYFTLADTYSHSLDNTSGRANRSQNVPFYSTNAFYASSDFDVKNTVTMSGGWDLPLERTWKSGPKRLLGGWSLYPIFSWRTGFPLNVNAGLFLPDNDPGPSGVGDPGLINAVYAPGFNRVRTLSPGVSSTLYFNPGTFTGQQFNSATTPCASQNITQGLPSSDCALANPALRTYGAGRNVFRGPGRTNLDLSLAKALPIRENFDAEFRLEAFNVFNHTQFQGVNTNITSPLFGNVNSTYDPRILQLAVKLKF
ncbi:MAG TPA: TonB-dependent receptor [Candidatus Angelobacter sp.]|nr:TonB-dependent receptor [Candidatus Angelobacter sp.]